MVGSVVWLAWSYYDNRAVHVVEGVAEVRDLVNEAIDEERMIDVHRVSDGALVVLDPVSIRFIEPGPEDNWTRDPFFNSVRDEATKT